jgi:LPS-assembly protein
MRTRNTTAKNNHVSGTSRTSRLKPLRAAMRSIHPVGACLTGLLLLQTGPQAAEPDWDCRMAADGGSWECSKDGVPVVDPAPAEPAAAVVSVPTAPAPPVAEPLPAADAGEMAPPAAPDDREPLAPSDDALPAASAAPAPPPAPARAAPTRLPTTESAAQPTSPDRVDAESPSSGPTETPADAPATPATTGDAPSADTLAPARPATTPTVPAAHQAFDSGADMPDLTAPVPAAVPVAQDTPTATPPQAAAPALATGVTAAVVPAADAALAGDIDAGIDWQRCRMPRGDVRPRLPAAAAPPRDLPVTVSADAAIAELTPERALFSGNVELVQGPLRISAEEITLDRQSGEVLAGQGFMLTRPDVRIAGDNASYRLDSGHGTVDQASYRIPAIPARGQAAHAAFLGAGMSEYRDISYTTCAPGADDWLLEAETLTLDQNEGLGTARHAKLRFLGVPVLYVPTFTFPIDDRRRSGLLVPSLGYSENTGVDLSVPYYLNLAPDYDLTLTPRLMSKRGAMLGGEFRFLTESTEGTLAAEFLPDDRAYEGDSNDRGSVSFRSQTRFTARADAELRLNYLSDSDYLTDLGRSLAATSATHVERTGEIRYHADTWDLLGRAQYYQTIDDSIAFEDRPYSRLPQLRVDLKDSEGLAGTTYHLGAEYVNFYRSDSVRGHRLDLFPAISLPLRNSWSYVEPKVGARYTAYRLTDQPAPWEDDPSHLTGMFSLDSGLYFDRAASYFGNAATQTLEPRLYYLFVPDHAQDDQPVFDTSALDFSFDNLFRENRFNGPDRFGDANQITLGLTSRFLSERSGEELLRASIGQILYFEDRGVTLPGEDVAGDSTSALAGEIAAQLGGGWRGRAGLQWDPHDGSDGTIEQALAQVNYLGDRGQVFNAAYRLRDGVVHQTDLAALWPVSEQLSLIARHNHSLKDDRLLEALAGIEYGRCCWRVRALLRQYTDDQGDDHNLAFLLQLELNGLGRLGNDIDATLERGIYGYRKDDED